RDDNGEKVFRYSIRKYHFGAASVAVAALMFFANGAVAASETITPVTASDVVTAGSDGNADGNPASSGEGANQTGSTEILQPRVLKSKQSNYEPISFDDDEDDVDDTGEQFSESLTTTIQPRSTNPVTDRSVQPKENSSGVHSVRAEAKKNRFGQVKGKKLIHGDDPANYIKFKDANNQEVQKPAGVDVAWAEKPSTTQEGLNKTGRIKITYHLTNEDGIEVNREEFVTINTPVYHATLTHNRYVTTYGGEFTNRINPTDGRRYINYNAKSHFQLNNLRAYWEHSSGANGSTYSSVIRDWNTRYLGKKREKLMVRYPSDDGIYRSNRDDGGERYEIL
ncbi:YSIRK-type signal peptide-containing protein, partial [Streptococcus pneumoniae]|nr:YSIRK-type signal peptide-containing protein [Streptococcus pneumoniae]